MQRLFLLLFMAALMLAACSGEGATVTTTPAATGTPTPGAGGTSGGLGSMTWL